MKVQSTTSSPASHEKPPPSTLVGPTSSIVVSDDELSIPSVQQSQVSVANKVYQEWTAGTGSVKELNSVVIEDQDFMDVDEFFQSDLLPEQAAMDTCDSLDFNLEDEPPLSMTVAQEEHLIHPFSPMPTMKLTMTSWDDNTPLLSPPPNKDQKYLDACASPTSLHGEMACTMEEEENFHRATTVSPLPSPPLTEESSLEDRLRQASLKLAESMRRSQMTRASLTFKPMVESNDDNDEEHNVSSLLNKIEESTNQLHVQFNLQRSKEDGFSEENVRKLLLRIEQSTSQLQRRFSNETPKETTTTKQ